jgi:bifunctional non-homologous end joining protein LigD
VRFSEWTGDLKLRAPVFVRFREDKEPAECRLPERDPDPLPDPEPPPPTPAFVPTHTGKVFWPGEGFTKGDLIGYYAEIEKALAPHLRDRPLVLDRYPDGIDGEHFFQKQAPEHLPEWVRTEVVESGRGGRAIRYVVGCGEGLLGLLANLGTITQNPWISRIGRLEYPDQVVFDLDPSEGVVFGDVRRVALEIGKVLEELELRAYPKTSGASGIHVYLPLLEDRFTYAEARDFAVAVASVVVDRIGPGATLERSVARRPEGVYIDCFQNARGQTVASVYSPRARPGAPVSTPLRWEELRRSFDPGRYNIRTVPRRLRRMGDLFGAVLEDRQDISHFLEALGKAR